MQAIHADNVTWKTKSRGVREAEVFRSYNGAEETRIDLVEVPAGGYIPPHRHSSRREFITILLSAGAQLRIGERIFRPVAGQVFHREPRDILALTNDSHHPFRYSVVRFGYESSDVEWLNEDDAPEDFGEREVLANVTAPPLAKSPERVEVTTGAVEMEVNAGHPDREEFQSGKGMTAAHGASTDTEAPAARDYQERTTEVGPESLEVGVAEPNPLEVTETPLETPEKPAEVAEPASVEVAQEKAPKSVVEKGKKNTRSGKSSKPNKGKKK